MAENDKINKEDEDELTNIFKKIQSIIFNIKSNNQLSDSILNYFSMSVGFFMFGCNYAEIIIDKKESEYLFYGFLLVAGLSQLCLGVYEWYKGKTIAILENFSFGFLFISWYLKWNLTAQNKDNISEGVFYIIWTVLIVVIIIGFKNKGAIYSLNYLAVLVGFIFLFISKYADKYWIKKTYGFSFIVAGGLFWITGLLRLINRTILSKNLGIIRE